MAGLPDDVVPFAKRLNSRERQQRQLAPPPATKKRVSVTLSAADFAQLLREVASEGVLAGRRVSMESYLSSVVAQHCASRRARR